MDKIFIKHKSYGVTWTIAYHFQWDGDLQYYIDSSKHEVIYVKKDKNESK